MKLVAVLFSVCVVTAVEPPIASFGAAYDGCSRNVTKGAYSSMFSLNFKIFKNAVKLLGNHFTLSVLDTWRTLAVFAETARGVFKEQMFDILNLPHLTCLRREYYSIAAKLEVSKSDSEVVFRRKRFLFLDDSVLLNMTWANEAHATGELEVLILPLKRNSRLAFNQMRRYLRSPDLMLNDLKLAGNSVIMTSTDYEGLWDSTFKGATIHRDAEFHNDTGNKVGTVDLIVLTKRVRLTYLPGSKVIELPIGLEGKYSIVFLINTDNKSIEETVIRWPMTLIKDIMKNLRYTKLPIHVAIPRFFLNTVIVKQRELLEGVGVTSLWVEKEATKSVSEPAALPSDFVHRASISLESVEASAQPETEHHERVRPAGAAVTEAADAAAAVGQSFQADRPFMFIILNKKTKTVHISGIFSKPNQATPTLNSETTSEP